MKDYTAHQDTFARDRLPQAAQQPEYLFDVPSLKFPEQLNCAQALLKRAFEIGDPERPALFSADERWTYRELDDRSSAIANVLVNELQLVPGNRVLLRAPNNPMLVACWLAVLKAGGIAVATMPMLQARDLMPIIDKAQINLALCDSRLVDELAAAERAGGSLRSIIPFNNTWLTESLASLNDLASGSSTTFDVVDTSGDDIALIAFTSGTTGIPKGAIHYHRDVLAMCVSVVDNLLHTRHEGVFIGSPPLAFTFGLGMLLAFPMWCGASTVLLESAPPLDLAKAINQFAATVCATEPTAYRAILASGQDVKFPTLKTCVSAGEHLPLGIFNEWERRTGLRLINGLGATEMIHIFVSASGVDIRPGAVGKALPGYRAAILDDTFEPIGPRKPGHLAVIGPTGCKYLDDKRQSDYVKKGWNITGDICSMDEDGYVWFEGRSDDMIVTSGYNVATAEVEEALLLHVAVAECAVVGVPDPGKGSIVKAFVRLVEPCKASEQVKQELKEHVKRVIAPYKYPRQIEFVDSLPKTPTGKIQRHLLKTAAHD